MNVSMMIKGAALVIFCLCLSACSGAQLERKISMDLASRSTIFKYEWVERNAPEVHVYPPDLPGEAPTALLVPFRMMQAMAPHEGEHIAQEVTRVFWQTWLKEEILPVIEYDTARGLQSLNRALAVARAKGADMLITGQVNYFLSGGTLGLTQVGVRVEMYDVHSSALIWSIVHGGNIKAKATRDYIFFAAESKLPADPVYAVCRVLAWDIAAVIKDWISPSSQNPPQVDGMRNRQTDDAGSAF
jgi:hypothetical protein